MQSILPLYASTCRHDDVSTNSSLELFSLYGSCYHPVLAFNFELVSGIKEVPGSDQQDLFVRAIDDSRVGINLFLNLEIVQVRV